MNTLIAGFVGALVAALLLIAGVNQYSGDPEPVSNDELYSYGDA